MSVLDVSLRGLVADLRIALQFCTRFPLLDAEPIAGVDVARASWAFPVAGVLVGLLASLVYWLADLSGLPPLPAAFLALAATLLATGCLHEDGLADMADGFGGGATRERKLEIMRDSRIGTYGVCALTMSLLLRGGALASLGDPKLVVPALIAAHASSRATMPMLMWLVPQARNDGLSADAGQPPRESVAIAGLLGVLALGLGLGALAGIVAVLCLGIAVGVMARLCRKQIGGQTYGRDSGPDRTHARARDNAGHRHRAPPARSLCNLAG
jgi:adenosylcobinamide-GDP ribazoletransferase